jgi:hypothetical protein
MDFMSIAFFTIQILVVVTIIYFILSRLDNISKSNYHRNELLKGILDELKRQNENKN